jgi:hypothetical protein
MMKMAAETATQQSKEDFRDEFETAVGTLGLQVVAKSVTITEWSNEEGEQWKVSYRIAGTSEPLVRYFQKGSDAEEIAGIL